MADKDFKHAGLETMALKPSQFEKMDQKQLMAQASKLTDLRRTINKQSERIQAALSRQVSEDRAKYMASNLSADEKEALKQVLSQAGGIPSEESVNGG